jgi:hypothetical protein
MTTNQTNRQKAIKRLFEIQYRSRSGEHSRSMWATSAADAERQFGKELYPGVPATFLRAVDMYPNLPGAKEEHFTWEQCLNRYPRLSRLVADILIGSESEAACCIRDYRSGLRYGSEAVSHSGLSPHDRVQHAIRGRSHMKASWMERYRQLIGVRQEVL